MKKHESSISRRVFLQHSTLAAAGALAWPVGAMAAEGPVAVIGEGRRAEQALATLRSLRADATQAARLTDGLLAAARAIFFTEETPETRLALVEALAAKRPVLWAGPLPSQAVLDELPQAGMRRLAIHAEHLHPALWRQARQWLDAGEIGAVRHVHAGTGPSCPGHAEGAGSVAARHAVCLLPVMAALHPRCPQTVSSAGGGYDVARHNHPATLLTSLRYEDAAEVVALSSCENTTGYQHPVFQGESGSIEVQPRAVRLRDVRGVLVHEVKAAQMPLEGTVQTWLTDIEERRTPLLNAAALCMARQAAADAVDAYRLRSPIAFNQNRSLLA